MEKHTSTNSLSPVSNNFFPNDVGFSVKVLPALPSPPMVASFAAVNLYQLPWRVQAVSFTIFSLTHPSHLQIHKQKRRRPKHE